eukprot:7694291-Pyramimonas_sp.AAC.1
MRCTYRDAVGIDIPGRMLSLAHQFARCQYLFVGTLDATGVQHLARSHPHFTITPAAEASGCHGA